MAMTIKGNIEVTYKSDGDKKRLRRAAQILESLKLPRNAKFNMRFWGEHKGEHAPTDKNYCGTAACGWGWLSLQPSIQRDGVKATWVEHQKINGAVWHSLDINFGGEEGLDGARLYFDITSEEADWLFTPEKYSGPMASITPARVAKRLRMLVDGVTTAIGANEYSEKVGAFGDLDEDAIRQMVLTRKA